MVTVEQSRVMPGHSPGVGRHMLVLSILSVDNRDVNFASIWLYQRHRQIAKDVVAEIPLSTDSHTQISVESEVRASKSSPPTDTLQPP